MMKVVQTGDGSLTLVHKDHGEWFHSEDGAKLEAYELYIRASGYLDALDKPSSLSILDVGLGLGYNACSTLEAWSQHPTAPSLSLLSLESDGDLYTDFRSSKGSWQTNWPASWLSWCQAEQITHPQQTSTVTWQALIGDGRTTLAKHDQHSAFNFIWQDPFSKAHGTDLWDTEWFKLLYNKSAFGCVLMTYSVARPIRDALTQAGWSVEKIETTTRKRHWLRAEKREV